MMDVIVIVYHLLIPPISSYRMEGGVRIQDGGCLRVVWRYPIDREMCVDGPSIEYAANAMSRSE